MRKLRNLLISLLLMLGIGLYILPVMAEGNHVEDEAGLKPPLPVPVVKSFLQDIYDSDHNNDEYQMHTFLSCFFLSSS